MAVHDRFFAFFECSCSAVVNARDALRSAVVCVGAESTHRQTALVIKALSYPSLVTSTSHRRRVLRYVLGLVEPVDDHDASKCPYSVSSCMAPFGAIMEASATLLVAAVRRTASCRKAAAQECDEWGQLRVAFGFIRRHLEVVSPPAAVRERRRIRRWQFDQLAFAVSGKSVGITRLALANFRVARRHFRLDGAGYAAILHGWAASVCRWDPDEGLLLHGRGRRLFSWLWLGRRADGLPTVDERLKHCLTERAFVHVLGRDKLLAAIAASREVCSIALIAGLPIVTIADDNERRALADIDAHECAVARCDSAVDVLRSGAVAALRVRSSRKRKRRGGRSHRRGVVSLPAANGVVSSHLVPFDAVAHGARACTFGGVRITSELELARERLSRAVVAAGRRKRQRSVARRVADGRDAANARFSGVYRASGAGFRHTDPACVDSDDGCPVTVGASRVRRRFSPDVFVSSLASRDQRLVSIGVRTGASAMIRLCGRVFGDRIDRVQLSLDDPTWRYDDGG